MLMKNHVIILYPLQIGDGLCSVISTTLTSVSCVTTAHFPGNFMVDVRVEGMGTPFLPKMDCCSPMCWKYTMSATVMGMFIHMLNTT